MEQSNNPRFPMKTSLTRRFILAAFYAPVSLLAADSAVIKAPLHATGDADAAGMVLATLREKVSTMIVQARNLAPSHSFDVEVAGIVEGSATTTKAGRLNLRFRTPAQKKVALLDFDPRGQTLRILDGGVSVLEGVISGGGEDDGIVVSERAELSRDDAPAKAKGRVTYTVTKKGRRTFRVDLTGLDDNPHYVLVDGIERGEVHRRGKTGVLIFDTAPANAKVLPLDFDPRGSKVDIVTDDKFVFTGEVEAKARGVNVAAPSITGGNLPSTGADADGSAHARLRIDERARKHFSVEIEDVPVGAYDLLVDGTKVGTIDVVNVTGGTKGEIEFESGDDDTDEIPLTFDPAGKTLTVQQGATKFFEGLFNPNTTGGGVPPAEPVSFLEENLTSTGLDSDASGDAKYEVDDRGRHDFSVEIEDVPVGAYTLTIGGVVRGTISVKLVAGKTKGELEFSSKVEPGHKLLNFDPRGQTIEVSTAAGTFFTHLFGNGSATPGGGGGSVTPFEMEVALISSGADANAEAKAELKRKLSGEFSFEVEVEDVDTGAYELLVGGVVRATIDVVADNKGTRGKVEFETEIKPGKLPLNFEVAGQEIVIRQGATTFFARTFPTP